MCVHIFIPFLEVLPRGLGIDGDDVGMWEGDVGLDPWS
jgi:hypothetical protein